MCAMRLCVGGQEVLRSYLDPTLGKLRNECNEIISSNNYYYYYITAGL